MQDAERIRRVSPKRLRTPGLILRSGEVHGAQARGEPEEPRAGPVPRERPQGAAVRGVLRKVLLFVTLQMYIGHFEGLGNAFFRAFDAVFATF